MADIQQFAMGLLQLQQRRQEAEREASALQEHRLREGMMKQQSIELDAKKLDLDAKDRAYRRDVDTGNLYAQALNGQQTFFPSDIKLDEATMRRLQEGDEIETEPGKKTRRGGGYFLKTPQGQMFLPVGAEGAAQLHAIQARSTKASLENAKLIQEALAQKSLVANRLASISINIGKVDALRGAAALKTFNQLFRGANQRWRDLGDEERIGKKGPLDVLEGKERELYEQVQPLAMSFLAQQNPQSHPFADPDAFDDESDLFHASGLFMDRTAPPAPPAPTAPAAPGAGPSAAAPGAPPTVQEAPSIGEQEAALARFRAGTQTQADIELVKRLAALKGTR